MHGQTLSIPLAALSLSMVAVASAIPPENACPPSRISVRLPPDQDPALNGRITASSNSSTYQAPPPNFYAGTWYQTNTSYAAYVNNTNLQWDLWPVIPNCVQNTTSSCSPGTLAGVLTDVATWSLTNATVSFNSGAYGGGNRPVASLFAYDTPRRLNQPQLGPGWDGVYDQHISSGALAGFSESWSVLYWGSDVNGVPFMVAHESNGLVQGKVVQPPRLNTVTRSPNGPEQGSLEKVLDALRQLNDTQLTKLVNELAPINWDHSFAGGSAICPKTCMENQVE